MQADQITSENWIILHHLPTFTYCCVTLSVCRKAQLFFVLKKRQSSSLLSSPHRPSLHPPPPSGPHPHPPSAFSVDLCRSTLLQVAITEILLYSAEKEHNIWGIYVTLIYIIRWARMFRLVRWKLLGYIQRLFQMAKEQAFRFLKGIKDRFSKILPSVNVYMCKIIQVPLCSLFLLMRSTIYDHIQLFREWPFPLLPHFDYYAVTVLIVL